MPYGAASKDEVKSWLKGALEGGVLDLQPLASAVALAKLGKIFHLPSQ
jgi:hypothetical protein